ncbi:MAG: hypothetical protein HRT47_01075 [Candidatus Caenarcaniphilales bacterium]|nr:hypothetical protein [Candidatus Caenarcaniphilales bacterium]
MEINKDLEYYKNYLQDVNKMYEENILGSANFRYTEQAEVTPIMHNEIEGGEDAFGEYISDQTDQTTYNNGVETSSNVILEIGELNNYVNNFIDQSKENIAIVNNEIDSFMINIIGIPAENDPLELAQNTDYYPDFEKLKYLGEGTQEVEDVYKKMIQEYEENQISLAIFDKEQTFLNDLGIEDTYNTLGTAEKEIFIEILNTYDDLVVNFQSEAQNENIQDVDMNVHEGMIGAPFSKTNVAAMKLNKAKEMLTKLSEGMSVKDLEAYEKTFDYEIEFNEQLSDAVAQYGVGSDEANILSAKAEASRRAREFVESVHTMKTSNDALDQAVVASWEADGIDPLSGWIIEDMESDIIQVTTIADVKALYTGEDSKYAQAKESVTSMKEKALKLTNFDRDGAVETTEIAALITTAYQNGGEVDGIDLDVIKAALIANGVNADTIQNVENTLETISDGDMIISFDEALDFYKSMSTDVGWGTFRTQMDVLAVAKIDEEANPELFTTIGDETFFTGNYEDEDTAVLSQFLASSGRYVHTVEDKFEALDAFHDNAGDTSQQKKDWREYRYNNWAANQANWDAKQDIGLAWHHKAGNANVTDMLDEMQDLTQSRTDMMTDAMEYGDANPGSDWWNDFSLSYFENIRNESNVFLVGLRGGDENKLKLMDMIGEAIHISYADRGNYIRDYIDVDIANATDNVSGNSKVDLIHFEDNFVSDDNDNFTTSELAQSGYALFHQSNQQYHAMWGLRSALFHDVNNNEFKGGESQMTDAEAKFIENQFHEMMDIGDQMEAYLYNNGDLQHADAKNTDEYRELEEKWFLKMESMMAVIQNDETTEKVVANLGGFNDDGTLNADAVEDVLAAFHENYGVEGEDLNLDFNSDGIIDTEDYDIMMKVVGDKRHESGFDALLVNDSMNLGKTAMYSGLAKGPNVSDNDKLLYESLEFFFAEQSDANETMISNIQEFGFASDEAEQRFIELTNMLDQANEAVELKLRESISTDDEIALDPELGDIAINISNEMMMLSLGFNVEDSAALAEYVGGEYKITDEITDESLSLINDITQLKDDGLMNNELRLRLISGVVNENSSDFVEDDITTMIQDKFDEFLGFAATHNDGLVDYFDSMIEFYQTLINDEESKENSNQTLISSYEGAMTSFETQRSSLDNSNSDYNSDAYTGI